ncbi:MAG: vanadium-dependent haloperoxidase [Blastocatellia bacterium]
MNKKEKKQKKAHAEQATQSRRDFLGNVGGLTAATLAAGVAGLPALESPARADELDFGGLTGRARAEKAYDTRVQAALFQKIAPRPDHPTNGDEDLYANKIGSYSKGLPHNQLGEVDRNVWEGFMTAIKSGNPDDFDRITMGGGDKLTSPQSGLAYDMAGADTMALAQPPAPAFAGAEIAAEIAENYWMALGRDVNFADYDSHPITNAAAADLSKFSDFRGPKLTRTTIARGASSQRFAESEASAELNHFELNDLAGSLSYRTRSSLGQVTTGTLFRGLTPGDLAGPYISQFLWKDTQFGAQPLSQKMRTVNPGVDYLTNYGDWLDAQNGKVKEAYPFDPAPRYIRNGRDLSEWVHIDVLFQAYFNAMLVLMGVNAPVDANNPYRNSRNQKGFATFGPPHVAALLCGVASQAIKAVWYQKWFVHRRVRPEAFAGRIHNHVTKAATYPLHPEILNSAVLPELNRKNGTYLLPMAFPEGCPTHPAYGAGHATVAGACTTILKAWFDETYVLTDPVVPTPDGLALVPYRGSGNLTVGGELNKVASNVAVGRNIAGVHWRSDATESLKLGEAVAISVLQDYKGCYNERFEGFSLTKFDGTRIIIG